MRNLLFLTGALFLFSFSVYGQEDSIPKTEPITTASINATSIVIALNDPEETSFALKKIHTYKYLEYLVLEGETDEATLKKLLYRVSVLKNLRHVIFRENELLTMPENISLLRTMQCLTIEGNSGLDYEDLCQRLKSLPLQELNLIDNDIKQAPASLSGITSLRRLRVSGSNQIDYVELVERLSALPSLTMLSISVNYISELPPNIDKLKQLQVLDVSNNNLIELPQEISALKAINNLSIHGNLLLDPPKDLEKLKGNNIQYLSLDKEIDADDLEKIRTLFPTAQIDFPLTQDEEPVQTNTNGRTKTPKPTLRGELKVKKEYRILSGTYALYPTYFQRVYTFDTLNFAERYNDLRYANTFQIVDNGNDWTTGTIYFRKSLMPYEKPGKKKETWFRLGMEDGAASANYMELRAFSGMYWVYQGELSKRQFKKKYISRKQRPKGKTWLGTRKRKRKMLIRWNDIRVTFDKNNSLFSIRLKSDSGFTQFTAYPVYPNLDLERCQMTYNKKYILYEKALLRRAQRFNKTLQRNRAAYDKTYESMREYAWKELQLRMSDEEKAMSKEEWFDYFDAIVADEEKAIEASPLLMPYIQRGLFLKDYPTTTLNLPRGLSNDNEAEAFGSKDVSVDFMDQKTGNKLAVTNVLVVDNKKKLVHPSTGTLGLSPNLIRLRQFSGFTILVEVRNGNWAVVSAEEIDKQQFQPGKIWKLQTQVFDKNLNTVGELLKMALK